jgi:hypothetical protein
MEEFRIIEGFENYAISNLGRIQRVKPGIMAKVGVFKKPQVNKTTGYTHVKVTGSEGKRSMAIHRLVAEAFIPNPDGLREIDHIDRDKQNNQVENLRWCTRRENMANIAGRKALVPILAYPPDGGVPLQFECLRDAAKYIAELIGEAYGPQGISNVLNNPAYIHYKGWRFEKLPAEKQ